MICVLNPDCLSVTAGRYAADPRGRMTPSAPVFPVQPVQQSLIPVPAARLGGLGVKGPPHSSLTFSYWSCGAGLTSLLTLDKASLSMVGAGCSAG